MIIIDQVAESKLAKTLETLEAQSDNARAIYFNLHSDTPKPGFVDQVIASAKEHVIAADANIYLCGDGDIFILAPTLPSKAAHLCMLAVGEFLGRPVTDDWAGLYELPLHTHILQTVVGKKLAIRRKAEEEALKLQEQQQKERKRQTILRSVVSSTAEEIAKARAERSAPELMIIEDDAFSRRLVENVLQKNFSLTGLAEATQALTTYVRLAPDLLFLDIDLPDVTGHELLEKIIAVDPNAYVIMLSGNADKENITQAMGLGAKGFIAKPFTREKLFQYIDRCPTIKARANVVTKLK